MNSLLIGNTLISHATLRISSSPGVSVHRTLSCGHLVAVAVWIVIEEFVVEESIDAVVVAFEEVVGHLAVNPFLCVPCFTLAWIALTRTPNWLVVERSVNLSSIEFVLPAAASQTSTARFTLTEIVQFSRSTISAGYVLVLTSFLVANIWVSLWWIGQCYLLISFS